jgi:retron-type reverse transcriptase
LENWGSSGHSQRSPKNHSDISNYRPITLLPEHAKIFEKIVRRKLEENLNPLHSPHQFGFSKGKSSTDALHRLTSKITGSRSKYVATLFFDIKGAFDNLWWPGLIQHLRRRGLQPNLLAPGEELPDGPEGKLHPGRRQHRETCTKGCPQGSVLGPTLWNLVLDSLLDSEWSHWTTPIAYADDLAVIVETNERTLFK